mgnify:FL=1|tara:strand:+ start:276 stop:611 length:336 start_codon:yes stop_codon:yes gene_type:complete
MPLIILKEVNFNLIMDLFGKSKEEKIAKFKEKQSIRNGKELKKILKIFKEDRDEIEKRTGKRPDIDDTSRLFMQKVLNVWLSEGRDIDDEKFWHTVDYNKQFDYPVEYYER